jgi:virginiamycin B lyase
MFRRSLMSLLTAAGLLAPADCHAASFTGHILLPDGKPAFGAMLTVFDESRQNRETVYTAADGSFAIRTAFAGQLQVRARLAGYDDAVLAASSGEQTRQDISLTLKSFDGPEPASLSLAASAFNARLPWDGNFAVRATFVSQCNYCHQLGNATTRVPRSHQEWLAEINKMEAILALPSQREKSKIAAVLTKGFDGQPVQASQTYGASAELARAKVREWNAGDDFTFIHDADIARDQKLYGTDEGHDLLWVLDRASGKIERYALPDADLPRGGYFSGMTLPIGVFSGKHGPHSMAQTSDGRIWITNSLSSTLMSFDPASHQFKTYPMGEDTVYLHTIRADAHDVLWFTSVASNHVVRFDPKTEKATVIRLPSNGPAQWVSEQLLPTLLRIGSWFPGKAVHLNLSTHRIFGYSVLPFPYGIDVNPSDGSIWYAKLNVSKIGRIDPATLAIQEWDTPMRGPRRPRFDQNGVLWIPAFDDSCLMRFDPATQSFATFKIPPIGAGEYETPYALNIDRRNGEVWMSANNSDRILRYFPATGQFLSYPSPTRVTFLRDFAFAQDGNVCSSSSNLPSYAIEGGRGGFICVDPAGGEMDRQALSQGSN